VGGEEGAAAPGESAAGAAVTIGDADAPPRQGQRLAVAVAAVLPEAVALSEAPPLSDADAVAASVAPAVPLAELLAPREGCADALPLPLSDGLLLAEGELCVFVAVAETDGSGVIESEALALPDREEEAERERVAEPLRDASALWLDVTLTIGEFVPEREGESEREVRGETESCADAEMEGEIEALPLGASLAVTAPEPLGEPLSDCVALPDLEPDGDALDERLPVELPLALLVALPDSLRDALGE
jgi:hypothetical protein